MSAYSPAFETQTAPTVRVQQKNDSKQQSFASSEYVGRHSRQNNLQTLKEKKEKKAFATAIHGDKEIESLQKNKKEFKLTDVGKSVWQPQESLVKSMQDGKEKARKKRLRR